MHAGLRVYGRVRGLVKRIIRSPIKFGRQRVGLIQLELRLANRQALTGRADEGNFRVYLWAGGHRRWWLIQFGGKFAGLAA